MDGLRCLGCRQPALLTAAERLLAVTGVGIEPCPNYAADADSAYISIEAVSWLLQLEEPLTSPVEIVLSILSLVVMPVAKQRVGQEIGSRALVCRFQGNLGLFIYVAGVTGRRGCLCVARLVVGRPRSALSAMLPVIVWQGWETLAEARERGEEGNDAD